jgi:hypothetical protein
MDTLELIKTFREVARREQLLLPVVELGIEHLAQLQGAVHHQVEHAQHQVRGTGGQAAAPGRAQPLGLHGIGQVALDERPRHVALGRVHRDQQAVEHDEADGARADAGEGGQRRLAAGAVFADLRPHFGLGGEPAEDHQVVDRGVVVVGRVRAVAQVLDVQVEQLRAAELFRGMLQGGQVLVEGIALQVDPDEARVGGLLGHRIEKAQRAPAELDDLHCSRRAASSAK